MEAIVASAKANDWQTAEDRAFRLNQDQVGQGR
jgi:hypothetical protein